MSEKSKTEQLKKELTYSPSHAKYTLTDAEIKKGDKFCEDYIDFLNKCRTEREANAYVKALCLSNGYKEYDPKKSYKAGDRVYSDIHGKSIILCTFGKKPLSDGAKILASHIDSPRLDLKPNPLYESQEIAMFKTHYYGGIKKYQWPTVPLSLHGVVYKRDGSRVDIRIGDDAGEPKFVVSDLLPHLDKQQADRPMTKVIKGEELNIIIGSRPYGNEPGDELVKLNVLKLLNDKYGITEADFMSAELEAVPAYPAVSIGLDMSMIGSYGHDDRVCAYPSVMAAFAAGKPTYTTITVLTDKEEVGSDGNTGLQSAYLEQFIADIAEGQKAPCRDVLRKAECLSADVNAGFDPTFPEVYEKRNACFINKGIVLTKYTGSGGKGGTNDANAEFVSKVRTIFDKSGTLWQTGELGKVDEGGGGTVAKYVANLGINVVDVGVPVLSMHAPFELVAKTDVYMAFKGFKAFLESK